MSVGLNVSWLHYSCWLNMLVGYTIVRWLNIVSSIQLVKHPFLSPDLRQLFVSGPWRVRLHPGGEASFHRVALPTGFLIGPVDAVDGFRYGKMVNLWKTGKPMGLFWENSGITCLRV